MTQFINFYNVLISCTQRNICLWISNDSRDFIRSNAVKAFISFCRDFIKCWKFIFFWEKNYCGGTYAFSVRLFSFALLLFLWRLFFCVWTSTRHKQNDKITLRMRKSWVFERRLLLLKCVVDFSLSLFPHLASEVQSETE